MLSYNIFIISVFNIFVIVLVVIEIIMIIKVKYNNVLVLECLFGNEKFVLMVKWLYGFGCKIVFLINLFMMIFEIKYVIN